MTTELVLATQFTHTYKVWGRHVGGVTLIVIGGLILVGWAIVAPLKWSNIVQTNPRLGYLICDVCLVAPGCLISGIGLLTDAVWGPPTLLIAVGAAAFDLTHTFTYIAVIGFPKIGGKPLPVWAYGALILGTLVLLDWIAWREIRIETGGHIPALLVWLSIPAALVLVGILVLGVLAGRTRARVSSDIR